MAGYTDFEMKEGDSCIIVIHDSEGYLEKYIHGEFMGTGTEGSEIFAKVVEDPFWGYFAKLGDGEEFGESGDIDPKVTYFIYPDKESIKQMLERIMSLEKRIKNMQDLAGQAYEGMKEIAEQFREINRKTIQRKKEIEEEAKRMRKSAI